MRIQNVDIKIKSLFVLYSQHTGSNRYWWFIVQSQTSFARIFNTFWTFFLLMKFVGIKKKNNSSFDYAWTFLCWQKLLRCLYIRLLQLFFSKKILYSLHRNLVIWKGTKYFHFYEHKTMIYWCWYDIKFYSDWKYFWNAADEWTHVKIQSTLHIFVKTIDKRSPHYVTGTFLAYIICSV